MSRTAPAKAVLSLVILSLALGCGGSSSAPRYTDRQSGLSLNLPPGWSSDGSFFLQSRDLEVPSGAAFLMPMEADTLENHAKTAVENIKKTDVAFKSLTTALENVAGDAAKPKLDEAQKSLDSTVTGPSPLTIGPLSGFEAVIANPDITTIFVFLPKGSRVLEVSFRCESKDWPTYEPLFRASIQSIALAD